MPRHPSPYENYEEFYEEFWGGWLGVASARCDSPESGAGSIAIA